MRTRVIANLKERRFFLGIGEELRTVSPSKSVILYIMVRTYHTTCIVYSSNRIYTSTFYLVFCRASGFSCWLATLLPTLLDANQLLQQQYQRKMYCTHLSTIGAWVDFSFTSLFPIWYTIIIFSILLLLVFYQQSTMKIAPPTPTALIL